VRGLDTSRCHYDSVAHNFSIRHLLARTCEALRVDFNAALGNNEARRPFRGDASGCNAKGQNDDKGNAPLRGAAIRTE